MRARPHERREEIVDAMNPGVTQFETRARRLREAVGALRADRRARLERSPLDGITDVVDVPIGRRVVVQGEYPMQFFVIESGIAHVSRDDHSLAELGPGDFFGEIALLLGGMRTASVVAATEMRLRVVHRREFARLLRAVPALAECVHDAIERRLAFQAG
jgi:CRP/FNR family cyclic AMP-dependent transcriptional regulator